MDRLSRRGDVENLSLLLRQVSSPIVFSVNAPWGCGKTTLLEMLNADLQRAGCRTVFFSAWEADFTHDSLQVFLGEISREISSIVDGDEGRSEAWDKAKRAGVKIARKAIPAIIKLGTAGVLDIEKAFDDEASKVAEALAKDFIDDYSKGKGLIEEFKRNLKRVFSFEAAAGNSLFVFVDELDRCRPTCSIEFLERIKHLLDIEGLVFVIAMDKDQLSHSVKAVYGEGFDSVGYLRRFIDIEYALPRPGMDDFIDGLYGWFGFEEFFSVRSAKYNSLQFEYGNLKDVFKLVSLHWSLSLREVEHLVARMNLVVRSTAENEYIYPPLLVFLLVVREFKRELYLEYVRSDSTADAMIEYLYCVLPEGIRLVSHECAVVEGFIIAAKMNRPHGGASRLLDIHRLRSRSDECSEAQRGYSRTVALVAEQPVEFGKMVSLSSLVSRIELSTRFKFGG